MQRHVAATKGTLAPCAVRASAPALALAHAGVMGREELRALKAVSASQGLMLESTSPALLQPGGAHYACPDKVRSAGLAPQRVVCATTDCEAAAP